MVASSWVGRQIALVLLCPVEEREVAQLPPSQAHYVLSKAKWHSGWAPKARGAGGDSTGRGGGWGFFPGAQHGGSASGDL